MRLVKIQLKKGYISILLCCIALAATVPGSCASPADGTAASIAGLIIKTGPYAGVPRLDRQGGINWYFANIALANALPLLATETRAYLDAYLRNVDPETLTIQDVKADEKGALAAKQPPDSHDAYAGTLLLLATRYEAATNDKAWWNAHLAALKDIAYANILNQVKDDGLVRVFQAGRQPAGIDPHEGAIGYLIDNCEAYAGLNAFVAKLKADRDADAAYYEGFMKPLADAIASLFDQSAQAWRPSDDVSAVKRSFYPDCLAQIYPGIYGVTTGTQQEVRDRERGAFKFLRQYCQPPRTADNSQRLAIAAYASTVQHDAAYAKAMAGSAAGDPDLPSLAWRLVLVKSGVI